MTGLPTLRGVVVHGDGRGRGLGFPTANLRGDAAIAADDGIYAARVRVEGVGCFDATVSIGSNPTFRGDRERRAEVHLHDVDLDLYGLRLEVELVAFLRPTLRFAEVDDLIRQAEDDVRRSRAALAGGA